MPKIVKLREYNPPNLLGEFSSNDISPATGNELGSADMHSYHASINLRLWLRFNSGSPADLVNYDTNNTPTISYEGVEETSEFTVYSSRMKAAKFDNVTNQYAELTFPGGSGNNNILTFGDGATQDLPFSVSLWFRKLPESDGVESADYLFTKGKSDSESEYAAWYDPSDDNLHFDLFAAGDINDRQRISVNASELSDNNWHHIVFTYNGEGRLTASDGMEIYIDGVIQSKTPDPSGTYTYMDGVSELLYIGGVYDGGGGHFEADGNMAEFAIWNKELSLEEVKAIYYWTRENSVVKSGYTNLPPRIRLRDLDNRPGCYPTKHRMGDKDRSGKANIFYEDLPVQFGFRIYDNFENVETIGGYADSSNFDANKWIVSSGMSIKTEVVVGNEGSLLIDKCAVFSGPGTAGERFIRSSKKIINPTRFYFELIQGPYNKTTEGLDLTAAFPSESFGIKLQISTDSSFSSPITVATYTYNVNQKEFYGVDQEKEIPPRRRKKVSLGLKDFKGLTEEYYFRFVQESFVGVATNWAIANIEIEYANQNVRYPLLLNHTDRAGNKIANSILGNTNISGSLTATGRSVKGISDLGNPFQDFSERISAFDETLATENTDDEFFNQGLDPDIYPGFTSPTRSKTKFTIDLSPSEETTFGFVKKGSVIYSRMDDLSNTTGCVSGDGQQLMVYYNHKLKKWEKKGQPWGYNNIFSPSNSSLVSSASKACVGFGTMLPIGTASVHNDERTLSSLFSRNQHSTNWKPIDAYAFPFGSQYHATSSQFVKAKNIGITKPLLVEKILLEYEAKFQAYSVSSGFRKFIYGAPFLGGGITATANTTALKIITPTFFMLRQYKDNFSKSVNFNLGFQNIGSNKDDSGNLSYTVTIPTSSIINSGSQISTYVDNSRELITFAQTALFLTGSSQSTPERHLPFEVQDVINAGVTADLNVIETWNQGSSDTFHLTKSFVMKAPVRNIAKYPMINQVGRIFNSVLGSNRQLDTLTSAKKTTSRNDDSLKQSRGIVNGFASALNNSTYFAHNANQVSGPNYEAIDLTSPYLIQPEDEIIFGWQYPLPNYRQNQYAHPGSDDTVFNSMTLFGKSKLHLYGSQVVENKEYYETVNQNLTSCAVYEHIIGDEKVTDQWQTAYRGELTGSYSLFIPYKWASIGLVDTSTQSTQATFAVGNHYFQHKNNLSVLDPKYKVNDISKTNPIQKIGLFSTRRSSNASEDAFNLAYDVYIKAYSDSTSRTFAGFFKNHFKYWASENGITSLAIQDQDRIYVDSTKTQSDFYDDSYYGTYGRADDTPSDGGLYNDRNRAELDNMFSTRYSGYNFNTKHFGYYADMFQQGKDSKFNIIPRQGFTTGFDIVVNSQSPVKIEFVSGSFENNANLKTYTKKPVEVYLDEFNFQSSNLSTAATSSMPFIDDNQPHNRSYIEQEYIAVPIF